LATHRRGRCFESSGSRKARAEPAPVSLDTGYALDDCIRRNGWLVFTPNVDVWGLPLPFGERPFRVASETSVVATGGDPRTVWLHGRDALTIAEYDGVARGTLREIQLPGQQFSVAALTPSGFILHDHHSGLYAWDLSQPPRLLFDDVGPTGVADEGQRQLVCLRISTDELVILDLHNGSHVTVPAPEVGRWTVQVGAFSPDAAWLAVDLDYTPETTQDEALAQIRQVALGQGEYEAQPHRLGIIRCTDGALIIADGVYDNFANIVWSLDSEWIVFTTPFAPRGLWLTSPHEPQLEWISSGRRHMPSLLCDASDLVR
jgi:hypothetical protein